jgi:hypothetical protein
MSLFNLIYQYYSDYTIYNVICLKSPFFFNVFCGFLQGGGKGGFLYIFSPDQLRHVATGKDGMLPGKVLGQYNIGVWA